MITRKLSFGLILSAVLFGGAVLVWANVGDWVGPASTDYPPNNGNLEMIEASGFDGLGDHTARKDLNLNNKRIYGVGSSLARRAMFVSSTGATSKAIGVDVIAQGSNGILATTNISDQPAVRAVNLASGYALMASSSRGLAAKFYGGLQLATSSMAVVPQLQWLQNSNDILSTKSNTPITTQLYWGNQLLCDGNKANCGHFPLSAGDNLGNHLATKYDLSMNNFRIININNNNAPHSPQATSSIQAFNTGTGASTGPAVNSVSDSFHGIIATTNIDTDPNRQSIRQTTVTGSQGSVMDSVIYNGKIYFGEKGSPSGGSIISHFGIDPVRNWNRVIAGNIAECGGGDYSVYSLATFNNKLYAVFKDSGTGTIKLYIQDDFNSPARQCLTASSMGLPNTIDSIESYNGKLYASDSAGCKLFRSNNGTTWNSAVNLPATLCNFNRMASFNGKLYISILGKPTGWTNASNLQIYEYDGTTATGLLTEPQSQAIGGGGAPTVPGAGWIWKDNALYVGGKNDGVWQWSNGTWSLFSIVDPSLGTGNVIDLAVLDDRIYASVERSSSPGGWVYEYNASNNTWDNTGGFGRRLASYRGVLLNAGSAPQMYFFFTYSQTFAAYGYNSGAGYGLLGWSATGPGATLYGRTQIVKDEDSNVPAQLILGSVLSPSGVPSNNQLSTEPAPGAATHNLYWGDKLLCNASQVNCGWSTGSGGNSIWALVGADLKSDYLISIGSQQKQAKLAVQVPDNTAFKVRNATTLTNRSSGHFAVQGNRLYTVVRTSSSATDALEVYDISNPNNVTWLKTWNFPADNATDTYDLQVIGKYAYIAGNKLRVIDVSDLTNPTPQTVAISLYNFNIQNAKIYISGTYAYIMTSASGGSPNFFVVDISMPLTLTNASIISQKNLTAGSSRIRDFDIQGKNLYLVADQGSGGNSALKIYDITNPLSFSLLGSFSISNDYFDAIKVRGTIAYAMDGYAGANRLTVLDVSNPAAVSVLYTSPNMTGFTSWDIANNYVFILTLTSGVPRQLIVYDVVDPTAPRQIPLTFDSTVLISDISQLTFIGSKGFVMSHNGTVNGPADKIGIIDPQGSNFQNLAIGSAELQNLLVSSSASGDTLYGRNGLVVGGSATVSQGAVSTGKIKIGTAVKTLDSTLLNKLINWSNL